jgi:hypothetical protein
LCARQVRVLTERCAASEELRVSSERKADAYRHSLSSSDLRGDAREAETAKVRAALAYERWAKLGALARARHEAAQATAKVQAKAQAELRAAAEAKAAAEAAARSAAAVELRRTSSAAAALGVAASAQRALGKWAAAGGEGVRMGSAPISVGTHNERGAATRGERGGAAAEWETSSWVPVIDVFSSTTLSESEGALMRRVIAARLTPGPTISYTGRPL